MAVVISGQSSFNKTFIVSNTAYDIALTLRDAETYGLSSRVINTTVKNTGYGVHFQIGNVFTLFTDSYPALPSSGPVTTCHTASDSTMPNAQPGNCVYEASYGTGQTERVLDYTIQNGITVNNFCVLTSGTCQCAIGYSSCTGGLTSLDVSFSRPNPSAFISANGVYSSAYNFACISITSPQGGTRFVSVESSGEIAANSVVCHP